MEEGGGGSGVVTDVTSNLFQERFPGRKHLGEGLAGRIWEKASERRHLEGLREAGQNAAVALGRLGQGFGEAVGPFWVL